MTILRKIIVKLFALGYIIKTSKTKAITFLRCGPIIALSLVVSGYFGATNPNYPTPSFSIWILYCITVYFFFLGFIYFRIWPVKWEELDYWQKFQYGFKMKHKMSIQELNEWKIIYDEVNQ